MTPDYNDGKWHTWNGETSKPATIHEKSVIEYVWHDERINKSGITKRPVGARPLPAWGNILKFRVTEVYQGPKEFWVVGRTCYYSYQEARSNSVSPHEITHVVEKEEWRPIETAPKDGSSFLGSDGKDVEHIS